MCLIVDNNVVHQVFPEPSAAFAPVHDAIISGRARMIYGGRLAREYSGSAKLRRLLVNLDRAGKSWQAPRALVDAEEAKLVAARSCRSDDPHVIALARVTSVRLLCTEDDLLAADFKSPALIRDPRGSVYRSAAHRHLIGRHCPRPCRSGRRQKRRAP